MLTAIWNGLYAHRNGIEHFKLTHYLRSLDSYGYAALPYIYGSVEEVRVANMGAEEYRDRTERSLILHRPERAQDPRPPPRQNLIWV